MGATNKLGLTDIERSVFYTRNGVNCIAEIRHYDPVMGLMKLLDPTRDEVIEFLYNRSSSTWTVPGLDYTCNVDWEVPVVKKTDTGSTAPNPVSRFPSSPL